MAKNRRGEGQDVNAGSMADIAFLLLIFFLVTTTIASDKGLSILLPPKREDDEKTDVKMKDRDVFMVLVNSKNQLLVEENPMSLDNLREEAKKFIDNRDQDPDMSVSPQKAAVSYKTDRGTKYSIYIRVLDEIKAAYNELRAEYLGWELNQYLTYDEKPALEDERLLNKVRIYCKEIGEPFSSKKIKEYLNFNPDKEAQAQNKKGIVAYKKARESGKELEIEKYYDAAKEYPLRISEAEPTKIGG